MHRLTARSQTVTVMTVHTLRTHLEGFSTGACRFTICKVHRDHVSIRGDYTRAGKKKHCSVVLPAYPTGSADDAPCNNLNVVFDPLSFEGAASGEEREMFSPLLGQDILDHYEKTHAGAGVPVSRCC
jgi:hypothetical protein